MRGRKPKPTWLKVIEGNPGGRPLNAEEPEPVGDLHDPPEGLSEKELEEWNYAIKNAPPGLLKLLDRCVFVSYVHHCIVRDEAARMVGKYGSMIRTPKGSPQVSPWLSILNKQTTLLTKINSELGFTPSSRTRVKVQNPPSTKNPFAGLKELGD